MKFQLITSASTLLLSTVPAALATGVTEYKCLNGEHCSVSPKGDGTCNPRPLGLPSSTTFIPISMGGGSIEMPYECVAFRDDDLNGMINNCKVTCPASCKITHNVEAPCGKSDIGNMFDGNIPDIGNIFGGKDDDGTSDPNLAAFSDMFVATPRGRNNNVRNGQFRNGRQVGVRQAQNIWNRLGGTCRRAMRRYPNAINTVIRRLQRARQNPRNQGRIAGLRQELQRMRRQCNGRNPNPPRPNPRNPQACIRFGNEAARRIAWSHCNTWPRRSGRQNQSWRRDCRDVAINQCRGQVATQVQNQCGLPNTRTLRQLENNCRGQVDSMIRNSRRFTEE
jgi:hypothetical protein